MQKKEIFPQITTETARPAPKCGAGFDTPRKLVQRKQVLADTDTCCYPVSAQEEWGVVAAGRAPTA